MLGIDLAVAGDRLSGAHDVVILSGSWVAVRRWGRTTAGTSTRDAAENDPNAGRQGIRTDVARAYEMRSIEVSAREST